MKTRREALVEAGLAKPGRGKFSTAAKAWLDEQRSKGVKFSDDDVPVPVAREKKEKTTVAPAGAGMVEYLFPDEYRFPESEFRAFYRVEGKKVNISLRECCNNCRVSLVNHGCESPTVHGNIVVTIERR